MMELRVEMRIFQDGRPMSAARVWNSLK